MKEMKSFCIMIKLVNYFGPDDITLFPEGCHGTPGAVQAVVRIGEWKRKI